MMKSNKDSILDHYPRFIMGISGLVLLVAAIGAFDELRSLGIPFTIQSQRWWVAVLFLTGAIASLGLLIFDRVKEAPFLAQAHSRILSWVRHAGFLRYVAGVLVVAGFSYLLLGRWGGYLTAFPLRLVVFWFGSVVLSMLLPGAETLESSWLRLGASALLITLVYRLALFSQDVSTYPFSLGWSEVSRYYYASLFFSEKIYGEFVPPSVLHPTRYLMQSVPFLFGKLPLWVHRLWQVLLWVVMTALMAWSLERRFRSERRLFSLLFVGWCFLFALQGPVYYHLLVMVVLVLLGYDTDKPVRSWIVLVIASLWAGISRLNWFPVPGMIAATLYFLERPVRDRSIWRYLIQPVLYVGVGLMLALGSQALYVIVSGNQPEQFTSSFTSDLLWNRLLPSATFPLGVLTGILIVSLPILALLGYAVKQLQSKVHLLRWLGIGGILLVLFGGGLVVSVKIGGGSNLHNMDAFLSLLLISGIYVSRNKIAIESVNETKIMPIPPWLVGWIFLTPLLFTIAQGAPLRLPDNTATQTALADLRARVEEVVGQGGDVLFVSQRHLPMFEYIPNVRVIHDYETVFLMEMVMGNNKPYLERFYSDLQNHRFALIVIDPVPRRLKDLTDSFAEENNVFYERISLPLLAEYEQVKLYREVGIELFAPREEEN